MHVYAFWVQVYGAVGCMYTVVGAKYAVVGCMYAERLGACLTVFALPDSNPLLA